MYSEENPIQHDFCSAPGSSPSPQSRISFDCIWYIYYITGVNLNFTQLCVSYDQAHIQKSWHAPRPHKALCIVMLMLNIGGHGLLSILTYCWEALEAHQSSSNYSKYSWWILLNPRDCDGLAMAAIHIRQCEPLRLSILMLVAVNLCCYLCQLLLHKCWWHNKNRRAWRTSMAGRIWVTRRT